MILFNAVEKKKKVCYEHLRKLTLPFVIKNFKVIEQKKDVIKV